MYERIKAHVGHAVDVRARHDGATVAIECLDCNAVLVDASENGDPETVFVFGRPYSLEH